MPDGRIAPTTIDSLMAPLVESAIKQLRPLHIPQRVWQERPREVTWRCSCGCINKHIPLPANLRCANDKENEDA